MRVKMSATLKASGTFRIIAFGIVLLIDAAQE
jgi:hypothetical protein